MYYKLLSNCPIVDGVSQSLVIDLQRKKALPIHNELSVALKKHDGDKIENIYNEISKDGHEILEEFITELTENNILHLSENPINKNLFPDIKFDFHTPDILSHFIITIFRDSDLDLFLNRIKDSIAETRCSHIQIRFEEGFVNKDFTKVFHFFDDTNIRSISVVVNARDFVANSFEKFIDKHKRIMGVVIYGYQEVIEILDDEKYDDVEFTKANRSDFPRFKSLNDLRFLGVMTPNILKYAEAQKHNLYYHKKVYIESDGNIYNAPFTDEIHGDIFIDSLLDIVSTPNFQKYWYITKDEIEVCCDCEFRYTCVDGHTPIKKNEKYSLKEKCLYNPFKATFNEN